MGFFVYHFFWNKELVIVLSTMRSGSTLLKALLGTAPDVSHVSELDFEKFGNKYQTVELINRKVAGKIVVAKKPSGRIDFHTYPILPKIPYKAIVLFRQPLDTLISISKMSPFVDYSWADKDLVDYWKTTYTNLLKLPLSKNLVFVSYEDLVLGPKEVTKKLLSFIGSIQAEGIDTYKPPQSGNWEWGKDDGGSKIQSLKVVRSATNIEGYEQLAETVAADKEIDAIYKRLNERKIGYYGN